MTTTEDRVHEELAELFARHSRHPPDPWALAALHHLERDLIGACWALRGAGYDQPERTAWLAAGGLTVTATIASAWTLVATSKAARTSYRLRARAAPAAPFSQGSEMSEVELVESLAARLRTIVDVILRIYGGTEPASVLTLHRRALAWY